MNLTGKAKEDFEKWIQSKGIFGLQFNHQDKNIAGIIWNVLIIEWLDSVGLYISIEYKYKFFEIGVIGMKNNIGISLEENNTRLKATECAITKANSIYNDRNL